MIFVFGSNLAGRHGKGAALHALTHYGAVYGVGSGRQGNSYAIPTKDEKLQTLPLFMIRKYVKTFINYAYHYSELEFQVTRIGCGLAGYKDIDIAPMFYAAPRNCILPQGWRALARTLKRNNRVGEGYACKRRTHPRLAKQGLPEAEATELGGGPSTSPGRPNTGPTHSRVRKAPAVG